MKAQTPFTQFTLWRSEQLFNIDFASYTLYHHHFSKHFHDHYVIELVVKGTDTFYCAGKTYTAKNNQLVFINPGEVHTGSTAADMPLQYFSLYPDKKAIQKIADTLNISVPGDFNFQKALLSNPVLTQKFLLLFDSFDTPADSLQQQELFFDCMIELFHQPAGQHNFLPNSKEDTRIDLLKDFIRSNYKEELSLQQMAALVNLNPFHLVRLFKRKIGVSPYDYLLTIRTEKAKQLLRKGYKVQEAALQCGFYDSSHFYRSFYKLTGVSPKSFRLSKNQYRTSFKGL